MKKYEFTDEKHPSNPALKRIRALIDLPGVKVGDLGGWLEKEDNLSHDESCWVSGNARVYDKAQVFGNARVSDNAGVFGNALVLGSAKVYGTAWVSGNAQVYGNARVYDNASVSDNARVVGAVLVSDNAQVYDNARVSGNARVSDNARIYDNARVSGKACVFGNACVYGNARVSDGAWVLGNAWIYDNAKIESQKNYMTFSGLGSEGRFCTLFRTTEGHLLSVGCWSGTIDQFEDRVLEVYGVESDYFDAIPMLRAKIKRWEAAHE